MRSYQTLWRARDTSFQFNSCLVGKKFPAHGESKGFVNGLWFQRNQLILNTDWLFLFTIIDLMTANFETGLVNLNEVLTRWDTERRETRFFASVPEYQRCQRESVSI